MANLLLRDMEVVEQPFVRGRDGAVLANSLLDASVRAQEHAAVLLEPPGQVTTDSRAGGGVLSGRKALGMLLEALDAEEFLANELFVIPRCGPRPAPKDAKD